MKYVVPFLVTLFLGAFAFADTSLTQLPNNCINAYDECHNACMKTESGEWACTLMACETKVAPVCTGFQYETVDQLPATCTNALDECENTCIKSESGEWACTKMACETKVAPVCTQDTTDDTRMCTMEYMPVCGVDGTTYGNVCMAGDVTVDHEGECLPTKEESHTICTLDYTPVCGIDGVTYGNACMAGETEIASAGECLQNVGGDSDEHGCKASAGYAWNTSLQSCVRPWEQQSVFDFAQSNHITVARTLETFRPTDAVSRQEAAAIFVRIAEKVLNKSYGTFPDTCALYKDYDAITGDFKNIVRSACAFGLMVGNNGVFDPHGTLTRGQALNILVKLFDGSVQTLSGPMKLATDTKGLDLPVTRWELIDWVSSLSARMY